ncbi:MAG: hypothetical protein JST17_15785 [Bacteroidetes bacterium]|nr:hypothetical protein [Bacteroidota bacterium]MBS1932106.1 hypothetical protein [Bacteroidota bacterium]
MKKYIPHILIGAVLLAIVVLLITGSNKLNRKLDERVTLQKKDKIPYGLYVAYNELKYFFPGAKVFDNQNEPGYWDSLSAYDSGQAMIIITPQFYPDELELKKLIAFVQNGNDVFISTVLMSNTAEEFFRCRTSILRTGDFISSDGNETDSLRVSLFKPPFNDKRVYTYPGKKLNSWFYQTDSLTTEIIGGDELQRNNFIHLKARAGNLYVHLAPMAFTNYFLLHKNNIRYYENILSLLNPRITKIGWDEYFLRKRYNSDRDQSENNNLLSVMFKYPGLKAALLTALFTLIAYVIMESRRKQRYIPVISKLKNDSLDFVKTIGRLYYDKGDHKNLCKKMGTYFLEHVRNKFKLSTAILGDDFIKNLQYKSGCDEAEIRGIVYFIKYADDAPVISDDELINFHNQLESFYKKV